jgi:protein BCP1
LFRSIALKRLLRQLFTSDAEFFDIHALAQHILASAGQMGIGTTVKVDGTESDPYAYISLVDLSNIDVSTFLQGRTLVTRTAHP